MFFLCGTVSFQCKRCFSVKQATPVDVELHGRYWQGDAFQTDGLFGSPRVWNRIVRWSGGYCAPCFLTPQALCAGPDKSSSQAVFEGSLEGVLTVSWIPLRARDEVLGSFFIHIFVGFVGVYFKY
jgi:hypothetical protein|uniref:Zdhhc17 protein n=1 Tax=Mus musculus TaxID=10090 RepID=Q8BIT5_MOUSE|nr:Zdhhc17 protein [Mus musculus]BAC40614.1 unnamed protein product [Mus musculus]